MKKVLIISGSIILCLLAASAVAVAVADIDGGSNGITLVFLPAVSAFFIPKLLGGGQYFLIGNLIENQFITAGEWNFGSAISMIMAAIMMLLMMLVKNLEIRNQGGKEV